jgi:hypothetical protein
VAKNIVRRLFSDSGYEVCDFKEDLIDHLQQLLRSSKGRSATVCRLFSKPDLLALDRSRLDCFLIETKFRNRPPEEVGLRLSDLRNYLEYWRDSILVVVVPGGCVFYARRLMELESIIEGASGRLLDLNLDKEFLRIEEMFPRIRPIALNNYRQLIRGFRIE